MRKHASPKYYFWDLPDLVFSKPNLVTVPFFTEFYTDPIMEALNNAKQ